MNKKKILFLALWFLPQIGGMEMSSYEVVKILRQLGHTVQVVTADHPEAAAFDAQQSFGICRAKGVLLKNLGLGNPARRAVYYLRYYHAYYRLVKTAIRDFAPDEIIVADEQTRNWFGFYAGRIPYRPIVIASMPERREDTVKIRVVSKTLNRAKAVYCVSNSTKEKLCEAFGEKYRTKMFVLYRSISTDFTEAPVREDAVRALRERYGTNGKFTFLSVCRLSDKKGMGDLVEAVHLLGEQAQSCKFLICGDGPEKENLTNQICAYGLENTVVLCGQVSKEQIADYYDLCDCFVLPSVEESFGRVFVEAGSRGKASIGCAIGGVVEVIDHGQTGHLVAPNNPRQLAEALEKLKNEPAYTRSLAENMTEKVQKNFTFSALKEKWGNILDQEHEHV